MLFIKLAVTGGGIWLLFRQIDLGSTLELMIGADPLWMFAAVLCHVPMIMATAQRMRAILKSQGHDVPFGLLNRWNWISRFFVFFVSTLGMDLARGYYLKRWGVPFSQTVLTLIYDRGIGALAFACFSLPSVFLLIGWPGAELALLGSFALPVIGFVVWVQINGLFLRQARRFERLEESQPQQSEGALRTLLTHLRQFNALLLNARLFTSAMTMGLAIVFTTALSALCAGEAIGLKVDWGFYLLAVPLPMFLAMLPISVAGLGVREWAFVLLFGGIGVADNQALALSLLTFLTLVPTSVVGGMLFLTDRSKSGQ